MRNVMTLCREGRGDGGGRGGRRRKERKEGRGKGVSKVNPAKECLI